MSTICYIYTLTDPRTNQVRYVGKSINPKERYRGHKKDKKGNTYRVNWIMSLKKKGLVPIFEIIDIVDNTEWKFWENHWISHFKTWGFKLVNGNAKGDGTISYKHTEKTKKIIGITSTGRKHTEETKKLMSKNKQGIVFSESHLKNLSLAHIGQKCEYLYKSVIQIDLKNGNIIKRYNSIKEAETETFVNNSSITACCKGRRKKAGGFYWCYESEYANFKFEPYKKNSTIPKSAKQVEQIINGKIMNTFRSLKNASEVLKINRSSIARAIKRKGTAGGFKWKYAKK